jgi:predicted RNase H-like nuclease (RuvC/YqgF family)
MILAYLSKLNITDYIIMVGVLSYVVTLLKDWRPIRALRSENRELRSLLATADKKIDVLEARIATLQDATDLSSLHAEQKNIATILERVVEHLDKLEEAMGVQTLAIAGRSV